MQKRPFLLRGLARPAKRPRLESLPESGVAGLLLQNIALGGGHISTQLRLARAIVAETGATGGAVAALATLGGHGACPQNEERDLHSWLHGLHGLRLPIHEEVLSLPYPVEPHAGYLFCSDDASPACDVGWGVVL
jgi:hypothetical protein